MKHFRRIGLLAVAGLVGVGVVSKVNLAAADKPAAAKYGVDEVMKKLHKPKNDNPFGRVVDGKGSPEDKKMIVEYYESMVVSTPAVGDAAAWKKRTGEILAAAKAVNAGGDAKSLAALKTAANCKACHDIHRE